PRKRDSWLRWSPALGSADGAGAGHEADTQEARGGVQGEGGAGGDQRRPDCRRAGERIRGSPEPDLRLEEAAAGRRGWRFRRRRGIGGYHQRGAGRSFVPADWPAEGRKRFFVTKARQMSRAKRRALIEREAPALPVVAPMPVVSMVPRSDQAGRRRQAAAALRRRYWIGGLGTKPRGTRIAAPNS